MIKVNHCHASFSQLQLYTQYRGKEGRILLQDGFKSRVVAAERQNHEYVRTDNNGVKLFFSLSLVFPVITLFLCWLYVKGARVYIREYINEPTNYPTLAALYWIGQSFTFFVIVMDALALYHHNHTHHSSKSSTYDGRDYIESTYYNDSNSSDFNEGTYDGSNSTSNGLEDYQYGIIVFVLSIECILLFLAFVFLLILNFNDSDKRLKYWFKYFCYIIFLDTKVEAKEARLWLILSGLIPPFISFFTHIGYIIGGWISYADRSIAIVLLYIFVFTFLFWLLQHTYLFSVVLVRKTRKPQKKNLVIYNQLDGVEEARTASLASVVSYNEPHHHYQTERSVHESDDKIYGFSSFSLLVMLAAVVVLNGIIAYIGYGILSLPLLESIDNVMTRIYVLGQYTFFFVVSLLTYNVIAVNDARGLVSEGTLRVWRYLRRHDYRQQAVAALHNSALHLQIALKYFQTTQCNTNIAAYFRKAVACFRQAKGSLQETHAECLHKATEKLETAIKTSLQQTNEGKTPPQQGNKGIDDLRKAIKLFIEAATSLETSDEARKQEAAESLRQAAVHLRQAVKHLQKGVKQLRQDVPNPPENSDYIPNLYLNRDRADALMAALIFQKTNTSPIHYDGHYSWLLSSIEKEFD